MLEESKDNRVPPGSGAHKNGGEADQEAPVENVLSPVLNAGTGTSFSQMTLILHG